MLFKEQFLKYKRICLKVFGEICWKHVILLKINCATDTRFFYKQQFYKQRQAEIGKKIKQMLSNTLRLNFCFIHTLSFKNNRTNSKK